MNTNTAMALMGLLTVIGITLILWIDHVHRLSMERERNRHHHTWQVVTVNFVGGDPRLRSIQGASSHEVRRHSKGETVVLSSCKHCGELKEQRFIGQVDVPGFVWRERNKS